MALPMRVLPLTHIVHQHFFVCLSSADNKNSKSPHHSTIYNATNLSQVNGNMATINNPQIFTKKLSIKYKNTRKFNRKFSDTVSTFASNFHLHAFLGNHRNQKYQPTLKKQNVNEFKFHAKTLRKLKYHSISNTCSTSCF